MIIKLRYWLKSKLKEDSFPWKFSELIYSLLSKYIYRRVSWALNKKVVEIEITTSCNLCCFNCNRSAWQAPSDECMSLEQLEKFCWESIELNWRWHAIVLIGGEPTLHPQLFEILDILKRYKDHNSKCNIVIVTNGFGTQVNTVLSKLPDWVKVDNSNKTSNINEFSSYNVAPIDLEKYKNSDFTKGCNYTETCGLGFTRYGYFPCGPGASVDRVFGFDIGIKKLALLNDENLKGQLGLLCKYCGHFKDSYGTERLTEEKMSDSWRKAYKNYQKRKPNISKY